MWALIIRTREDMVMVVVMVNDSAPVRSLLSASLSLAGSFGPVRRAKKRTVACRSVGGTGAPSRASRAPVRWPGGSVWVLIQCSTETRGSDICTAACDLIARTTAVTPSGLHTHTDYKVTS